MNNKNESNQIVYALDDEGTYVLDKLAKWTKIIGIFLIAMGILTLLTIFVDYSNPISVLFSILLSIFVVYIGTRLTSSSAHLRHSVREEDSESLKISLNNLRQYFTVTGITYILIIAFMFIAVIAGAFLGFTLDEFSQF